MKIKFAISVLALVLGSFALTSCQFAAGTAEEDQATPQGWMELPEYSQGLAVRTHTFTLDHDQVRNFTYGWDSKAKLAHWVAYPLSRMYLKGSVTRTESWNLDPYFSDAQQPVLFKGFREYPKYDRGHQIPSGDRRCTPEANAQTFYFTNMTPQLGKNFNQGIWNALEGKVRHIAYGCDTLYVVTGCVLGQDSEYGTDNDGKKIQAPIAYYKALLRYKKGAFQEYSTAAFYLEHKDFYTTDVDKSLALPVNELEEKIGIDLFVNLPAKIGDANAEEIEGQDPTLYSWWWD